MACFPVSLCTLSIKVGLFLSVHVDHVCFLYFQEERGSSANHSWPFRYRLHLPGALALQVSAESAVGLIKYVVGVGNKTPR